MHQTVPLDMQVFKTFLGLHLTPHIAGSNPLQHSSLQGHYHLEGIVPTFFTKSSCYSISVWSLTQYMHAKVYTFCMHLPVMLMILANTCNLGVSWKQRALKILRTPKTPKLKNKDPHFSGGDGTSLPSNTQKNQEGRGEAILVIFVTSMALIGKAKFWACNRDKLPKYLVFNFFH